MSNIDKRGLRIPERKKHNWGQAVMRDCDFCQQWALTVKHSDGGCICASCCDSEYTSALSCALVAAIARAEAAEKRIAELEAREVNLPDRKSDRFWSGDGFEFDSLGYQLAVESAIKSSGVRYAAGSGKGE